MNLFSDSTLEQAIRDRAGQLDCSPQDLMAQALEALKNQRRSIYLSAPVNALVEGLYEEDTRIADLKTHGDFGIGTFNDLDGEMVLIDGEVFQLCANGRVVRVDDEIKTPFACACFFKADVDEPVSKPHSYEEFNRLLALCLPSPNMLYACRVDGVFKSVRTRSVPKQDNYRPLVEVTRDQIESTQKNIRGSLVGFIIRRSFPPSTCRAGTFILFLRIEPAADICSHVTLTKAALRCSTTR